MMEREDLTKPMLYDYYFTQLYRTLQQSFIAQLQSPPSAAANTLSNNSNNGGGLLHDESDFLKSLIREQDQKLRDYELRFQQMQGDAAKLMAERERLSHRIYVIYL